MGRHGPRFVVRDRHAGGDGLVVAWTAICRKMRPALPGPCALAECGPSSGWVAAAFFAPRMRKRAMSLCYSSPVLVSVTAEAALRSSPGPA